MLRRMSSSYLTSLFTGVFAATLMTCVGANVAQGVGLQYQDADPLAFVPNVSPIGAFESPRVDTGGLWGARSDFGANSTVWETSLNEDAQEFSQTLSGLAASTSYDVYAVYWSDNDENWTIRTGLTSGNHTLYSWIGNAGAFPVVGSVQGAPAALAEWDVPPPPGPATAGTQVYAHRTTAAGFGTDDPIVMMLGKAGTAVSDGSGNLTVFIEDAGNVGAPRRAWIDGLAYKPTDAAPLTATATLNRDTGALSISNTTALGRDIKAIRVESSTSGGLNATTWTSVASTNVNWTVTEPISPGTTPFATNLVESGTTNVTLAASGGTLNFGNVWNRSPFDQVSIHLILSDDTLAVLAPQVTGTAIVSGDLDADGFINTTDYGTLMTNIHTSLAGLTRVDGYRRGDMTGDGAINFSDFAAFRTAYDVANGAGAFAQLVPEPGSLALCFLGGAFAVGASRRRRRLSVAAGALVLGLLTINTASAVPLIAVDFDDREQAQRDLTDVGNTQTGFQSFQMPGTVPATGNAASSTVATTNVLAGYTVTLAPFDDLLDENNVTAGVQSNTGAVDDRDRATPVDGGALTYAQVYDDFIFAGASTGPTGGIDVSVSGGALLPNKAYNVSVYSYDSGSGGTRTANWFDATNTTSPILTTSWAGAAANNPTNNDQYKFTGIAQTDASGVLKVLGRNATGYITSGTGTGAVQPAVFINAIEINEFAGLTLEVNLGNGATRLLNEQAGSLALGYYEIRSIGGALNTVGWNSLDDQENPDPVGTGWDEAASSSANILSEGNLLGQSTLAGSGGDLPLGTAFTPAAAQDLRFFYAEFADTALRAGFVKYVGVPPGVAGDYNGNGVVDAADYVRWRNGGPLQNEVATIGSVTAEDYAEWRSRFGNTSGSGSSLGGGAVPEPTTLGLLALAVSLVATGRLRSYG
jgi:hypothetical protein